MSGSESPQTSSLTDEMFRPPVNRAMRVLDRSFFQKDIKLAAAHVKDSTNISSVRTQLVQSKDILVRRAIMPVQLVPNPMPKLKPNEKDPKCVLLRPDIKHDDSSTWPTTVSDLVQKQTVDIIPYDLHLDYSHWPAHEILEAILPEDMHDDIPSGFNPVGHIAHFNLRPQHLPYKSLIGDITIDKNFTIKTVVNKTENLGESNDSDIDQFRVLPLEVIASKEDPPSFLVEVREGPTRPKKKNEKVKAQSTGELGPKITDISITSELTPERLTRKDETCIFKFDFSKVFWNTRLGGEHWRMVDSFKEGIAVCDVMAGVGPFAIPAGKKHVFVWANDLNPHCAQGLIEAIKLNKVELFVKSFCEDGHTFIKDAAKRLYEEGEVNVQLPQKQLAKVAGTAANSEPEILPSKVLTRPRHFSHFLMNLPATAIDFVPDFIGLYAFLPKDSEDYKRLPLPMVHCYCFGPKVDDTDPTKSKAEADRIICEQLSEKLGISITPKAPELDIKDVRNVAPNKSQFCASFRLPEEVAYRVV